jgi:hypothetical protein
MFGLNHAACFAGIGQNIYATRSGGHFLDECLEPPPLRQTAEMFT